MVYFERPDHFRSAGTTHGPEPLCAYHNWRRWFQCRRKTTEPVICTVMIKKIICPSDLSPAAQNAVAYAAKLCQLTGATLELIHSEPVSALERVFTVRRAMENTLLW